jgi:hypothetical protein
LVWIFVCLILHIHGIMVMVVGFLHMHIFGGVWHKFWTNNRLVGPMDTYGIFLLISWCQIHLCEFLEFHGIFFQDYMSKFSIFYGYRYQFSRSWVSFFMIISSHFHGSNYIISWWHVILKCVTHKSKEGITPFAQVWFHGGSFHDVKSTNVNFQIFMVIVFMVQNFMDIILRSHVKIFNFQWY